MWDSRKQGICAEQLPGRSLPNVSDNVGQPVIVRVTVVVKDRQREARKYDRGWIFGIDVWAVIAAYVLAFLMIFLATQLHAQTFTLLHTFTGSDGASPVAGLTMDRAGRLYGTTQYGGNIHLGTVFQLARKGSGWVATPIYTFNGNSTNDGARPLAGLTAGPDGSFFGTTYEGGGGCALSNRGCGTVYNLRPAASACKAALCPWTETVIYRFAGGSDGANPVYGNVVFDKAGNLYGTTGNGGTFGVGTVYELSPSNGGWTVSVLYSFAGATDGSLPWSGVIFDSAGNLYGTTYQGGGGCNGFGCGTIFELTPSGAGWTEQILYIFQGLNDGGNPLAGVVGDQAGNLYGASAFGGSGGGGAVFELTPSNGSWTFTVLYSLSGAQGPNSSLTIDAAGNLYGTAPEDPVGASGSVFQLAPGGGGWTYTLLHSFNQYDGAFPTGGAILDASGNVYGTAFEGGTNGDGTVWEITP